MPSIKMLQQPPTQMDFNQLLTKIQSEQSNTNNVTYQSLYDGMKATNDPDQLIMNLKRVYKQFQANFKRSDFFQLNFPQVIFSMAVQYYQNRTLFFGCCNTLKLVLSEQANSQQLLNHINKCLHKEQFNTNIIFYAVVANIVSDQGAAQTFLRSSCPQLFVKFYRKIVMEHSYNSQLLDALSFEQYQAKMDNSDHASEKSGMTVNSSLSLDDDGYQYKQRKHKVQQTRARYDDDTRSQGSMVEVFDQIGNEAFDDDVIPDQFVLPQDSQGDAQSQSQNNDFVDIDTSQGVEEHEHGVPDFGGVDDVSRKKTGPFNQLLDLPAKIRKSGNFHVNEKQQISTQRTGAATSRKIKVTKTEEKPVRKESYAISGPLQMVVDYTPKPQGISYLNINAIPIWSEATEETNIMNNYGSKVVGTKDSNFQQQLDNINERRQGTILLTETGNLLGQFIAMGDYPIVMQIKSQQQVQLTNIVINKVNKNDNYYDTYFGYSNCREITNYQFSFDLFSNILTKLNLSPEDSQRIGICNIFMMLLRQSPQMVSQYFSQLWSVFIFDLLFLKQKKSGFIPASALSVSHLMSQMSNVYLPTMQDEWLTSLIQMYDYANIAVESCNKDTLEIVDQPIDGQTIDKVHAILPSIVFLLQRLEGYRRTFYPEIQQLATQLKNCCRFHSQLAAIEDLPKILGVLVDRFECCQSCYSVRSAMVEAILPALLKILELIVSRKIKQRQYITFVSHRLLQLFSALTKQPKYIYQSDFQQANINELFTSIFLRTDDVEVGTWLRRYAYLITMNSRVKLELSGLFVSQQQCDITIEEMRITFGQFCKNLSMLLKRHLFIAKYNENKYNELEDSHMIEQGAIFPPFSNLAEAQRPLGNDTEYDSNIKLTRQPLHCLLANIRFDAVLQLKNKSSFLHDNQLLQNKFNLNKVYHDFSTFTYLLDFDTGVLSQYLQLNQSIIMSSNDCRKSYASCLEGLIELINLPGILQVLPQQQLNKHVIFHYLSFIKFYNSIIETINSNHVVANSQIAKLHLQVLQSFTLSDNSVIRQHLMIIKVVDFLIQQLMYESNFPVIETGRNQQQQQQYKPSAREMKEQVLVENPNNEPSNEENKEEKNLDFGLDSDDDDMPPPPKSVPKFVMKLPALDKTEAKNEKQQVLKEEPLNVQIPILKLNEGEVKKQTNMMLNLNLGTNETPVPEILPLPLPQFALKIPEKKTETPKEGFQPVISNEQQTKQKEELKQRKSNIKMQVTYNMDSDSDGWGDTAKRLNIDIGGKQKSKSKHESDQSNSSYCSSSSLPPPIKKASPLLPKLQLAVVPKKEGNSEQTQQAVPELPKMDINVKMHLVLAKNTGKNNRQAEQQDQSEQLDNEIEENIEIKAKESFPALQNESYEELQTIEGSKIPMIPLYFDHDLHYEIIVFIFQLIINPKTQTLDSNYVTQFPSNIGMYNIPVILHNHLNHDRNKDIVKLLIQQKHSLTIETLIRLLCCSAFNSSFYNLQNYKMLAKGAYGEVYEGVVDFVEGKDNKKFGTPIAIKVQKLNTNLQERCVLYDLYNEISVMQKLQNSVHFCQLLDFGVTPQGYIMIMKRYYTSFKHFREQLMTKPDLVANKLIYRNIGKKMVVYGHEFSMMKYVRIILQTYVMFLEHLKVMHSNNIIHFDLKADNLFVQPASIQWNMMSSPPFLGNGSQFVEELFSRHSNVKSPNELPFSLTIADFGESYCFSCAEDQNTLLSKGTEFNKSPEMLLSTNQQFSKINRRSQKGAGVLSDLWSAACTLYEMLTCDFLFYDQDWIRFFIRATQAPPKQVEYAKDSFTFNRMTKIAQQIRGAKLVPEKRALLGNCQPLIDLLEFQLVPDVLQRPNIQTCIEMTQHVLNYFFPQQYTFNENHYVGGNYDTPVPHDFFPQNAWFYDVIGSANECMFNPNEILTPKVSIICKDQTNSGTKLLQAKPVKITEPTDILNNGLLILGNIYDVNNITYLNEANIQTVIDCSSTNIKQYYTIINHIFRPSPKLMQIINESEATGESSFKDIIMAIEQVFDVIRCGMLMNGSVLIIDETGLEFAAMISIAALMEFEGFYLHSAIIYMKRLRPMIKLNQSFLQILLMWHDTRTKIGQKLSSYYQANLKEMNPAIDLSDPVQYQFISTRVAQANYRCICGKVFFVVKPLKPEETITYVACNCVVSDKMIRTTHHGHVSQCPCYSCRSIQNFFRQYYGYNTPKLLWGFVDNQNVISNWNRATMPISGVPPFVDAENQQLQFYQIDEGRQPLYRLPIKDEWKLQICRLCGYPTHYYRKNPQNGQLQLAVLCNFSNK